MNTIEEQLWDYIDGNCTPEEQAEITVKLTVDHHYYTIYQELLKVNDELNKLDFEEPSMSFTRNVMEKVNLELKPVALKTKVDNRIVYSIGGFFALALVSIFVYALATSNFDYQFEFPKMSYSFELGKYINHTSLQVFLFLDVVLALVYLDGFLRKRNEQKKGA